MEVDPLVEGLIGARPFLLNNGKGISHSLTDWGPTPVVIDISIVGIYWRVVLLLTIVFLLANNLADMFCTFMLIP